MLYEILADLGLQRDHKAGFLFVEKPSNLLQYLFGKLSKHTLVLGELQI